MKIALLLFFTLSLMAQEELYSPYNLSFTSIVHSEYEQSLAKENNSSFPNDSNGFASWYNILHLNYDINDNFYLSFGAKSNLIISEKPYTAPFYLRAKLSSDELNQAIISETSLNFDSEYFALSLGRNEVDYDWLLGSMDGVIASVGKSDALSLKLFWFQNFTQLQYNYYFKLENINDKSGIYGAIAETKFSDVEITIFDYFMQDLRNLSGLHVNYTKDIFALNLSYSSSQALSLAIYDYDESLLQLSGELLINQHYLELGASLTGENGLLAMIQLGSFMSGQFYLSNQVDRENAKNVYLKYLYGLSSWQVELIAGATNYDNSFLSLADNLYSYEVDGYLSYSYSRAWSLSLGIMGMNVDKNDPIGTSQYLGILNIGYHYELF